MHTTTTDTAPAGFDPADLTDAQLLDIARRMDDAYRGAGLVEREFIVRAYVRPGDRHGIDAATLTDGLAAGGTDVHVVGVRVRDPAGTRS